MLRQSRRGCESASLSRSGHSARVDGSRCYNTHAERQLPGWVEAFFMSVSTPFRALMNPLITSTVSQPQSRNTHRYHESCFNDRYGLPDLDIDSSFSIQCLSHEEAADSSGAFARAGRQRVCWYSNAFWRERMQHEPVNGWNGLLQGCTYGRREPRSHRCALVLRGKLLARRIDAAIRCACFTTIPTRCFGLSGRHARASSVHLANAAHRSFAWSTH